MPGHPPPKKNTHAPPGWRLLQLNDPLGKPSAEAGGPVKKTHLAGKESKTNALSQAPKLESVAIHHTPQCSNLDLTPTTTTTTTVLLAGAVTAWETHCCVACTVHCDCNCHCQCHCQCHCECDWDGHCHRDCPHPQSRLVQQGQQGTPCQPAPQTDTHLAHRVREGVAAGRQAGGQMGAAGKLGGLRSIGSTPAS